MRTFLVSGTFEAEDIDDALRWLGRHFGGEASGIEMPATRLCNLVVSPLKAEAAQATESAESS